MGVSTILEPGTNLLRCLDCGYEMQVPLPIGVTTLAIVGEAFRALHEECLAGDGICPRRDPDCGQPADEEGEPGHSHDACEAPPGTLVDLLVGRGECIWIEGDGWQSPSDVGEFLRAVAEVARLEGGAS